MLSAILNMVVALIRYNLYSISDSQTKNCCKHKLKSAIDIYIYVCVTELLTTSRFLWFPVICHGFKYKHVGLVWGNAYIPGALVRQCFMK